MRDVHCGTWSLSIFLIGLLCLLPLSVLAAPGDLDLTFSGDGELTDWWSRGDDSGHGVAIQQDGKIVVAGSSWIGVNTCRNEPSSGTVAWGTLE